MTRHGLLWLIAIIVIFLFAPLVVRQTSYQRCYVDEMDTAFAWYKPEDVSRIVDRTNTIYDWLMVQTEIDPFIRAHMTQQLEKPDTPAGKKLAMLAGAHADRMENYWSNFLQNIWLFCFRFSHSLAWFLYLAPFIVAIIFDGIMTRKAKLASFRYTSPTVYNLSWHTIIFLAAGTLVTFAIISPLPILLYPTMLTAMGILVRLVIANIQHSA